MKIGGLKIKQNIPLFLAPMAGVTDMTFRMLCREEGADVTCTEMVSAKALSYNNRNTFELLRTSPGERPAAVQLFGSDPALMAEMAQRLEDDFDIIDVNMGCPVAKVVSNGEGSSLMRDPRLAASIISAMAGRVRRPVTVKIRAGFSEDEKNAPELAKRLEDAGAAAIAIHARTREQMYRGRADWDIIKKVRDAVSVPVIGNGDVFCGADALRMVRECGVDAVMIARGAQGNPWIFSQSRAAIDGTDRTVTVTPAMRREMILAHAAGLVAEKGESRAMREMRKHLAWYTAGLPGSAAFRATACCIETEQDLKDETDRFFRGIL